MREYKRVAHDGKISAMDSNSPASQKAQLRERLRLQRDQRAFDEDIPAALNQRLAELCLINGATKVAGYLPFGNEPDVELFLDWAIEEGIEILLPVANQDGSMHWVRFEGETTAGIYGFEEAVGEVVEVHNIDLMIIPALAIDRQGNRLGKGKGYYDRALASLDEVPKTVAVVYDDEVIETIPHEPHDHPVDAVATEKQLIHFTDRLK